MPEELARKTAWFHEAMTQSDGQPTGLPLRCPCCGFKTLSERFCFEICIVCDWEDDGQDDHDAEVFPGGPNGSLSLTEARANFRRFEACDERSIGSVRSPRPDELPD